ncbi:MAG: lipoprotein-releasing system permease protein [Sphingobacteriales bacterium]
MRFILHIAGRYLFSKKKTNVINIISGISVAGVFIGSAALLIILSVFNGLEDLVVKMQNTYVSDLRIEPVYGKVMDPDSLNYQDIKTWEGVAGATQVLEENAYFRFGESQHIGRIKGVDHEFIKNSQFDSALIRGDFILEEGSINYAFIGLGVEYALNMNLYGGNNALAVFVPKKRARLSMDYANAFSRDFIYPSATFSVDQDYDSKYVIVPLRFARKLLDETKNISFLDIYLNPDADSDGIQEKLKLQLGEKYRVKNRIQQNEVLYKILNSERWAVYLILTFILLIAICNIVGSMTMLVIDKRKDMAILMSMGASRRMVRNIFLSEGILISLVGVIAGLLIGGIFCYLQMTFGFIKAGGFTVGAYPVKMAASDFVLVFGTVIIMGFIASLFASNHNVKSLKSVSAEVNA